MTDERVALNELSESPNLVTGKSSNKGGNVVLFSEQDYEQEIMRKLGRLDLPYLTLTSRPTHFQG